MANEKTTKLTVGMKVRVAKDELGLLETPNGERFCGSVEGKHPNKKLRGWWLVRFPGGFCPVMPGMVEAA